MIPASDKPPLENLEINQKVDYAKSIIKEAIAKFGIDQIAIAITGGKDSTTTLWLFKQVCEELGQRLPVCIFIDEGDVFEEISNFVSYLEQAWSLDVAYLKNSDVSSHAAAIGDLIPVNELNPANQMALQEIGFTAQEFPFIPDSVICNHLMKTVPLREFLQQQQIKALVTAIRWDEQATRRDEEFFSARTNPDHTRVHPILHFRERDIWISIFKYDIPYTSLYKLGYRSLGARCATSKVFDIPAWMQDLENTPERVGRGEEKEQVMDQLRALGYM